mmetsp:Transcript_35744/g.69433  ORF Transcript_35744/g.69433 Transcript_35744/m.69433 type:complete len:285 (-) Transcript_35744:400-1254(-)
MFRPTRRDQTRPIVIAGLAVCLAVCLVIGAPLTVLGARYSVAVRPSVRQIVARNQRVPRGWAPPQAVVDTSKEIAKSTSEALAEATASGAPSVIGAAGVAAEAAIESAGAAGTTAVEVAADVAGDVATDVATTTAAATKGGIAAKLSGIQAGLEQIPLMPKVLACFGFVWNQLSFGSPLSYIMLGFFLNQAYIKYRQMRNPQPTPDQQMQEMMRQMDMLMAGAPGMAPGMPGLPGMPGAPGNTMPPKPLDSDIPATVSTPKKTDSSETNPPSSAPASPPLPAGL